MKNFIRLITSELGYCIFCTTLFLKDNILIVCNKDLFDVIHEDDKIKANEYKLRADLLISIRDTITKNAWKQHRVAEMLSISQSKVCEIIKGNLNEFDSKTLSSYLSKLEG